MPLDYSQNPVSNILKEIIRRSILDKILRFIICKSYLVCKFSQNWGLTQKFCCSLKAVSAVIPFFPLTIPLIMLGGTERFHASLLMLMIYYPLLSPFKAWNPFPGLTINTSRLGAACRTTSRFLACLSNLWNWRTHRLLNNFSVFRQANDFIIHN